MGDQDEVVKFTNYDYRSNSNVILQTARRTHASNDPTGEAESLWGHTQSARMGDREVRSRPKELEDRMAKARKRREAESADASNRQRAREQVTNADPDELTRYRPKTRESKAAYETLLTELAARLDGVEASILAAAAEETLATLKNDRMRDPDRHATINALVGRIDDATYARLVDAGKRIQDYSPEQAEAGAAVERMDDELGVAVVFGDDDDESRSEADDGAIDATVMAGGSDDDDGPPRAGRRNDSDSDSDSDAAAARVAARKKGAAAGADSSKLDPLSIDARWLEQTLATQVDDIGKLKALTAAVWDALSASKNDRECESRLVAALSVSKLALIKNLLKNRSTIVYCMRLAAADSADEKDAVIAEMRANADLAGLLRTLLGGASSSGGAGGSSGGYVAALTEGARQMLDLDALEFQDGGRFLATKTCELPEGSLRTKGKGYEQVFIPAQAEPPLGARERIVAVSELPEWAQPAFPGIANLNRLQSRVFPAVFGTMQNLLICAPTGGGKTNVAMLAMLNEVARHRNEFGGIDLSSFKIVYIAPMKSLVAEMVGSFSKRLEPLGIKVRELSGDVSLSKTEIAETQVIISTPEKWDVLTRKSGDRLYTQLVRLLIIDEVHLLHDERGPVLEALVARTIRQVEATQEQIRIIGLSATCPNFEDVATFLRVDLDSGLFHFDNSYRPCPLQQTYVGITEKKPLQRFAMMQSLAYEKVAEQAGVNQMLLFVHSRKDTVKLATYLRDQALQNDILHKFVMADSASREILEEEAARANSADLRNVLVHGFAMHHAGMTRADRTLVEDLFAAGHVQIIVCTATLAWGVNLPAHSVIIVGTQVYNPEKGRWVELSYLDIMQMLGRAGRPGFDTFGEGTVITSATELQYYLALQNEQLSIESQLVKRLPDMLNAEIVLGSVQSVDDAAAWLGYTYLYIRMLRSPAVYSIPLGVIAEDPLLVAHRRDLVHTAAAMLDKGSLVKYDRRSGALTATDLGRVAAHFYITHKSMATYKDHLQPAMADIDIFRVFALSEEFKHVVVRQEEKLELAKLLERVPIPVKESVEEPTAKVNVLLQAYVSGLKLEGFALLADMVYITQSASRIMRALFEIVLRRGWARLAVDMLRVAKMVDRQQWSSQSPLRQIPGVPDETLAKIEKKDFAWERYYDLTPQELGELVRFPKLGKQLYKWVHQFPRLELSGAIQPVSRSIVRVELTITPDFQWEPAVHGFAQTFHVLVEDCDSEELLHAELFVLTAAGAEDEHLIEFFVELTEPMPPQYYVRVVSDRFIGAETLLPLSFRWLVLPAKEAPPLELLDLQPVDIGAAAGGAKPWAAMWRAAGIQTLNPIQTQTLQAVSRSSDSMLVCAPPNSGKTLIAELAILRAVAKADPATKLLVFYVVPIDALADARARDWSARLGRPASAGGPGLTVAQLSGESALDLKTIAAAEIIVGTPTQFEQLTRRWRQRKAVQGVALVIADELHLLGSRHGPTLEVFLSRMRVMATELERRIRIVGLGSPMADATDVGEWLGCSGEHIFGFSNTARPLPLEIHLQGFDTPAAAARQLSMRKPAFAAIDRVAGDRPVVVWAPSRKATRMTAVDLVTFASASAAASSGAGAASGLQSRFLHAAPEDLESHLGAVSTAGLAECLRGGVGFLTESMTPAERATVETLYLSGAVQVIVVETALAWAVTLPSFAVIVLDTLVYSGRERRIVDLPIVDLLQMLGRAGRTGVDSHGHALVLTLNSRKKWLRRFLFEPLPVESFTDRFLADFLSAEIAASTITDLQGALDWLTWTLFYRRLTKNPNFYSLAGTTHQHLSDHLSELVETTVTDLEASKTVERDAADGVTVKALNLGLVGAFYGVSFRTLEVFAASFTERTKLRGLLDIIAAAAEYAETVVVGEDEAALLEQIYDRVPHGKGAVRPESFDTAAAKTLVLLEAHFARAQLRADHEAVLRGILSQLLALVGAAVDTIASSGWLKPALAAAEISQMAVQAMWVTDSPLRQLPHLTLERVHAANEAGVTSVFELLENDEGRDAALAGLSERQTSDVARAANRFPSIDVAFEVQEADALAEGAVMHVVVALKRDGDDDDDDEAAAAVGPVEAPFYPKVKAEGWWLLLGDVAANKLHAIKKVSFQAAEVSAKLSFVAPAQGSHELKLFVICDAYIGADQELDVPISVGAEAASDSD